MILSVRAWIVFCDAARVRVLVRRRRGAVFGLVCPSGLSFETYSQPLA